MTPRPVPTRRRALLSCAFVVLTFLACAALLAAALLVPAPPDVAPLIVVACIGCPAIATLELPGAIAVLRAGRGHHLLAEMRRYLEQLPETQHPLDL
jgi:hypothetical protein